APARTPRFSRTGARTASERVAILVAPVVPVAAVLEPGLLLDLGSGNGSPGLVLALLRPELPVTLLEPRHRRWAFLREAARAAGRPDVTVWRARHGQYAGPPGQTVTWRALPLPLAELSPLVRVGGRVILWGPPPAPSRDFVAEPPPADGLRAFRRA